MGDDIIDHLVAIGPVGVDRFGQVARRGKHAGVGDEGQAERLHRLVVVVAVADVAPVAERQEPSEVVHRLAPVELAADPAPESFVGEPPESVEGAQELAVLDEGLGQRVLAGASEPVAFSLMMPETGR